LAIQSLIALYDQVEPAPEMVTKEAADAGCAGTRIAVLAATRQPEAATQMTMVVAPRRLALIFEQGRTRSTARDNGMGGPYAADRKFRVSCV
jgi:hypothetical protein